MYKVHLNSSSVSRTEVTNAMRRLRSPMSNVAIRDLQQAYDHFQREQEIGLVISHVNLMDAVESEVDSSGSDVRHSLSREDLHLVCFDYVWS